MRWGLLTGLLTGCADYTVEALDDPQTPSAASLLIEPTSISLGPIAEGQTASDWVTLSNVGSRTIQLQHVGLELGEVFAVTVPSGSLALPPGEALELAVTYTARGAHETDRLRVFSDDPVQPEAWVWLDGQVAAPALRFTPSPLVVAAAEPGDPAQAEVVLSNVGTAPLELSSALVSGDAFALLEAGVPASLAPGESTWARVSYTAPAAGIHEGILWTQDTTSAGASSVGLIGVSAVPFAQCAVHPSQVVPLRESADWLGADSFDASGDALVSYHWTLVDQPPGSAASLPAGDADRLGFVPDLAGDYVAELVVESVDGQQSAPCQALLRAVPDTDLWIEMFWATSGDDMDLHLLRPGGTLRTDGDCYFDNCIGGRLDWGVPGETADDPSLDLDDVYERGPENINLARPEHGTFSVYVHDYQGSTSDHPDENTVTVNIFLGGSLAWTDTRGISGEDQTIKFADVSWPDSVVTPAP